VAGDIVIVKEGTVSVGWGEYQPEVNTVNMRGTDNANTTKTGYKLASDGLDSIATTEPSGLASNFREMIIQLYRRFFGKATMSNSQILTYKSDDTVATTQAISETSAIQTQGEAS